jgi:hypothetical protein
MWTDIILVVLGLILGAICLGIGYLLGKKDKVKAQITGAINTAKDAVKTEVNKL